MIRFSDKLNYFLRVKDRQKAEEKKKAGFIGMGLYVIQYFGFCRRRYDQV
jgi:hypothetical protein